MQQMNDASLKWSNEEYEKRIAHLRQEFAHTEEQIKSEYEVKIVDLNQQIDNFKKEAEVQI